MGENKEVVQLKKRKLKEELSKEEPNKDIIRRLRESIKRHKKIGKGIRNKSFKRRG